MYLTTLDMHGDFPGVGVMTISKTFAEANMPIVWNRETGADAG